MVLHPTSEKPRGRRARGRARQCLRSSIDEHRPSWLASGFMHPTGAGTAGRSRRRVCVRAWAFALLFVLGMVSPRRAWAEERAADDDGGPFSLPVDVHAFVSQGFFVTTE